MPAGIALVVSLLVIRVSVSTVLDDWRRTADEAAQMLREMYDSEMGNPDNR
ncbi:MAG: hypothetical protein ACLFV7_02640 [Phycisphaerae bacterium]